MERVLFRIASVEALSPQLHYELPHHVFRLQPTVLVIEDLRCHTFQHAEILFRFLPSKMDVSFVSIVRTETSTGNGEDNTRMDIR